MMYKVRLTLEAKRQVKTVSDYIAQDSPDNARRWRQRLRERMRSLQAFPEQEIVYFTRDVGRDVRHILYGAYRILIHHRARRRCSPLGEAWGAKTTLGRGSTRIRLSDSRPLGDAAAPELKQARRAPGRRVCRIRESADRSPISGSGSASLAHPSASRE